MIGRESLYDQMGLKKLLTENLIPFIEKLGPNIRILILNFHLKKEKNQKKETLNK